MSFDCPFFPGLTELTLIVPLLWEPEKGYGLTVFHHRHDLAVRRICLLHFLFWSPIVAGFRHCIRKGASSNKKLAFDPGRFWTTVLSGYNQTYSILSSNDRKCFMCIYLRFDSYGQCSSLQDFQKFVLVANLHPNLNLHFVARIAFEKFSLFRRS